MNNKYKLRSVFISLFIFLSVTFNQVLAIEQSPGVCGTGGGEIWIGEAYRWNPAYLGLKANNLWSISLPSFGASIGNNSFSPSYIGDTFVEGKRLSDSDIDDLLSKMKSGQVNLNGQAVASGFGFTYETFGFNPPVFHAIGSASIPDELFNLIFKGWELDHLYSFKDVEMEAYTYWTTSFSTARSFTPPKFMNEFSVGATFRYIRGSQYIGTGETSGGLRVTSDAINTEGLVELLNSSSGNGFGMDLGAAGWLNAINANIGISFSNLFGSIRWEDVEVEQNRFERHESIHPDSLTDVDYWKHFFNESDTTYERPLKTTLPKYILLTFHKPALYLDGRGDLSVSLLQGLNKVPGNSFIPKLSASSSLQQLPWLNLKAGFSLGGIEGFELGGGFGLSFSYYRMDFITSWQRGVFNGAKGFSVALSNSIVFPSGEQVAAAPPKKPKKEKPKKEKKKKEKEKEEKKPPPEPDVPVAPISPEGMKAITLADLGFRDMDPGQSLCTKALYPFESDPVFYMEIGQEKYDVFLKDAAIIDGIVLMAERIIAAIEAGDEKVFAQYGLPEITAESPLYTFCKEILSDSERKTTTLISTGNQLIKSSRSDFTGLEARKLPTVIKKVNGAVKNLKIEKKKLPGLVEKLGRE